LTEKESEEIMREREESHCILREGGGGGRDEEGEKERKRKSERERELHS